MNFGTIGFSEMLVIAVLVLIFFGPRRFPEIGRSLGGALREFRRGLNEIQRELKEAERSASIKTDGPSTGAQRQGSAKTAPTTTVPAPSILPPQPGPSGPPEGSSISSVLNPLENGPTRQDVDESREVPASVSEAEEEPDSPDEESSDQIPMFEDPAAPLS